MQQAQGRRSCFLEDASRRGEPWPSPQSCSACLPAVRGHQQYKTLILGVWERLLLYFLEDSFLSLFSEVWFYLFRFVLFLRGCKCHQRTVPVFGNILQARHALENYTLMSSYSTWENPSPNAERCVALSIFSHCKT